MHCINLGRGSRRFGVFWGSIWVVCLKKIGWGRISRWPFRRQKRVSGRVFENVVGSRGCGPESSVGTFGVF